MRPNAARIALLLLALAPCGARAAEGSAPPTASELELRAAYLFNFAKFVSWPDGTFRGPAEPLALCVAGDAGLEEALAGAVAGKRIEGRSVVVRPAGRDGSAGCHLLYFPSRSDQPRGSDQAHPMLTVSDDAGAGAIVTLVTRDQRLRFAIDVDAARRTGLSISSRLLQLALPRAPGGGS